MLSQTEANRLAIRIAAHDPAVWKELAGLSDEDVATLRDAYGMKSAEESFEALSNMTSNAGANLGDLPPMMIGRNFETRDGVEFTTTGIGYKSGIGRLDSDATILAMSLTCDSYPQIKDLNVVLEVCDKRYEVVSARMLFDSQYRLPASVAVAKLDTVRVCFEQPRKGHAGNLAIWPNGAIVVLHSIVPNEFK